jgi:anti-anti-sigma regulatory factor
MLKVTVNEGADRITLILEGRLCGPCTAEAEQSWRSVLACASGRRILVDLTGVTYLGSEGKLLLTSVLEQGAEIHVDGVLMAHLVQELRDKISNTSAVVSSRRTPRPHGNPGVL